MFKTKKMKVERNGHKDLLRKRPKHKVRGNDTSIYSMCPCVWLYMYVLVCVIVCTCVAVLAPRIRGFVQAVI